MENKYQLVREMQHSLGVCALAIPAGTRLVSHDGGNTFRFDGFSALTVLTANEVSALLKQGIVREAS